MTEKTPPDRFKISSVTPNGRKVVYDDKQQLKITTKPGDVLIFNNQRGMHGRTAFDATAAEQHMRSYHVELDEFYNSLGVLYRRFGREEADMNLPSGAAV
ncbi:MAG: TauD/TfdA family dioxygenase [Acidiferrobacterales bacterium]